MSTGNTISGVDVDALFSSIDRFDAEAFGGFFASDATYVFANYPAVQGRDEIVGAATAFWDTVDSLHHKVLNVFPFDGGFVTELEITFGLKDGRTVTLPTAVITRTADGLITDHRIYVNETPLASEGGEG